MSGTRADGPEAVVLRCPNCGHPFVGLDGDHVWACAPCGRAWEVGAGGLVERRYLAWRAPRAAERVVWMPFWRIAHDAEVSSDDAYAAQATLEAAEAGRTWVRSYWLDGAFLIGDPGQALTAARLEETLDASPLPAMAGARISSAEALRLAELFILAAADRVQDVTPVTLRLVPREIALVAVPHVVRGPDVVCLPSGAAYRRAAVPDLEGMAAV